jgi:hypothetical protein
MWMSCAKKKNSTAVEQQPLPIQSHNQWTTGSVEGLETKLIKTPKKQSAAAIRQSQANSCKLSARPRSCADSSGSCDIPGRDGEATTGEREFTSAVWSTGQTVDSSGNSLPQKGHFFMGCSVLPITLPPRRLFSGRQESSDTRSIAASFPCGERWRQRDRGRGEIRRFETPAAIRPGWCP